MRNFLIVIAYILAVPALVLGPVIFGAWLSLESHRFAPWDPRYLLLVHGTPVGELDLMEPIAGSVEYTAQGQDGTAPAYAYVTFKTKVMPEQVIEAYSARCRAIGLAAQKQPKDRQKLGLTCEREEAEIGITAAQIDDVTEVTINGWEFE